VTPDRATAAAVRFERIEFSALPALSDADLVNAWPAWLASCRVLARGNGARVATWNSVCAAAMLIDASDAGAIRSYLAGHFDAWRVDPIDAAGVPARGRLTGYYEPELTGSRERRGVFNVPLARPPADLVAIELGTAVAEAAGTRLRGRLVDDGSRKRVVPYWTREELTSSNRLNGLEILWVEDPIEAFFLQVQGSGRVRLAGGRDDGALIRVGYADTNGHAYRSIGRWLIDRGELQLDEASMQGIQAWARANPKRIPELLNQNPSYVFFRELPLGDPNAGPLGALAVPLAAGVSAAVDPAFTPLGAPIVISSTHPGTRAPLTRLAIAQDTGSAIRGPARVDLFWGTGRAAGELAGRSRDDVTLWMLLPKGRDP
jgi:membrane-bound lytic murein transglycosylase A